MLSVIIPALDADLELRRCIDSVRIACGSGERCEIVVVMPGTRIESARALFDDVRFVGERHPSIYGAMNDGVAASRGRYLYFLGKDDIVLPAFSDALAALETHSPGALFFDVYWGSTGVFRGRPSRWRVLVRNVCHQGIVYSREVVERHGPYLRRMRVQADHLLNIRVLWDREAASPIRYIGSALAWYSGAGFSVKTGGDPLFRRLYPVTLRRYVGAWAAIVLVAWRRLRGR